MKSLVGLLLLLPMNQWRVEDRVVISDFSTITALAATSFFLYAATPRGLLIYDRGARRWQLPVAAVDGYPADVRVALADRADEAVWLGTGSGWARYDARIRQWQQGSAFGGVVDLAQDPADPVSGIYLRDPSGGWSFLPRGALLAVSNRPPPAGAIRPLDPRTALATTPQADALRALVLTDARLRGYQFTAAASTPDRGELFLGTNGLGVVRFENFGARWEPLTFGLRGDDARGLAPASDGVWVASGTDGLVFLPSGLDGARWVQGAGTRGFGFVTAGRMLARGDRLWVATEQGAARVDPGKEQVEMVRMDEPAAFAPAPDGVWVGTRRGLSFVADKGSVTSFSTGDAPVSSLLATNDTLWIGTTNGLLVLGAGAREPVTVTQLTPEVVVALARRADTIVMATRERVGWRDPRDGRWTLERPAASLGSLATLAADAEGVWVGGTAGFSLWRLGARTWTTVRSPNDFAGAVHDMLVLPPYLWVATSEGVVRFVREAVINR